ncbi:MAG: FHA domain-containing protein [Candidatus Promineofilum sp.]|nr:FHA domain-containing protein [Promineifilum sp.]
MNHCPACGAEHYPGTLFCEMCGEAVHPAAQAHVAAARAAANRPVRPRPSPTSNPPSAAPPAAEANDMPVRPMPALHVHLPHHDASFSLSSALIQIGRADPDDGFAPELDLTDYGGQERGVSRRHATIRWVEGGYVIIDQHSSNGTWLNGVRLVSGYAYQIPPQANLRLGGLLVQLSIAD